MNDTKCMLGIRPTLQLHDRLKVYGYTIHINVAPALIGFQA